MPSGIHYGVSGNLAKIGVDERKGKQMWLDKLCREDEWFIASLAILQFVTALSMHDAFIRIFSFVCSGAMGVLLILLVVNRWRIKKILERKED